MTIPATTDSIDQYDGNGVADTFDYGYKITNQSDLLITERDANGNPSVKSVGSDYTVSGVGNDSGGSVTRTAGPLPLNYTVTIEDNLAIQQPVPFGNQSSFFGSKHEDALDRLTRIALRNRSLYNRSVHLSSSDDFTDMELPIASVRANTILTFGNAGELLLATSIGSQLLSRSIIGQYYNPITDAESAANVTIANYYYKPGNIMRYGADPTGVADSSSAKQDMINQASHATMLGEESRCFAPAGYYKISNDIYCFHDATDNPNFNSDPQAHRWMMSGAGRGAPNNFLNSDYRAGTYFDYDAGTRLVISDLAGNYSTNGSGYYVRGFSMTDWSLISRSTLASPYTVILDGPRSHFDIKMGIHQVGDGWAVFTREMCCHGKIDMFINGVNRAGKGIKFEAVGEGAALSGTGGIMEWWLVLQKLEYPAEFGNDYSVNNQFASGWNFHQLDIEDCEYPAEFKHGLLTYKLNTWFERNERGGLVLSDSTGLITAGQEHEGVIEIRGNGGMSNTSAVNHSGITLGATGGTDFENAHGHVKIIDFKSGLTPGGSAPYTSVIRRYNSPENGPLDIHSPHSHNNGGMFLVIEDEAQIAPVTIYDASGLADIALARCISSDLVTPTNAHHWVSFDTTSAFEQPTLGSGAVTWDYSSARQMPNILACSVGGTDVMRVDLPDGTGKPVNPFRSTIIKQNGSGKGGCIEFDPGSNGQINGLSTGETLKVYGQNAEITIIQRDRLSASNPRYEIVSTSDGKPSYIDELDTSSGTSHEVTGIPQTSNEVILVFNEVSLNAVAAIRVNLGDSTGYAANSEGTGDIDGTQALWASNVGVDFSSTAASALISGVMKFTRLANDNKWVVDYKMGSSEGANPHVYSGGGVIDNGAETVDRVQITGTAFDGGTVEVYAN